MNIDIKQGDCLELLKTLEDNSVDLIFTDPPYALGSEIVIKENGKPDYKQARDFMSKWDMPTGEFWEEWYKEAYRVLKHGGHCLIFGMDRQLLLFKYYGHTAGFIEKQSLYWYFISNFPKATDLSKVLEKRAGIKPVGSQKPTFGLKNKEKGWNTVNNQLIMPELQTELAKKYNGYKYSIAPLKQTNETIMVFQKPYKHKSCLNDVLAYEEGDSEVTVGAVNIGGCRVEATKEDMGDWDRSKGYQNSNTIRKNMVGDKTKDFKDRVDNGVNNLGRFPAQTYIDSRAGEAIDRQSGISKSTGGNGSKFNGRQVYSNSIKAQIKKGKNGLGLKDTGGASRILHKCDYEKGDYDIYYYNPKVSKRERNEGLEGFEEKQYSHDGRKKEIENPYQRNKSVATNPHPTVKPIKLLSNILKLFKTPNKQTILDPFMGSGSMGVSAIQQGYNYIGVELSKEYFKIAKARIKHAQDRNNERLL